jgi:hypothetical protein
MIKSRNNATTLLLGCHHRQITICRHKQIKNIKLLAAKMEKVIADFCQIS